MSDLRQEKVTVGDKEYTFQEVPSRQFLKMNQRATGRDGQPILETLYDELLKHIVADPKVKMDDYTTKELIALTTAAMKFQLEEE
ncbi:hypothetical protein GH810_14475 [Acetobacterium paludosum]|uniref:Uncharacterized protein n=1 Tax=Acetobacterium paludosum TaxID=52693 RepID=A0A923HWD3_9FIRM|nr:hypothetical protein [Acetobacterium paludosum]MBC3889516.1 hypothetical protein [Acetobacterium paludosum]